MATIPRKSIYCLAGAFPLPSGKKGDYFFSIVHTPQFGWFMWEGRTMPNDFANADGHTYEVIWCDERVEFKLIEENVRLRFMPQRVMPMDAYIMVALEPYFYELRNALRAMGKEVSRSDFENLIFTNLSHVPNMTVGKVYEAPLQAPR